MDIEKLRQNVRDSLAAMQAEMLTKPQESIKPVHIFVNGMCSRSIMIPAGQKVMGRIHLTDHLNIMCGDITVYSEDGECRLTGYHVVPSRAGTKRLGVAHADTCWTTVLHTNLTTAEEVEQMLIANDYSDPRVIAINQLQQIGE